MRALFLGCFCCWIDLHACAFIADSGRFPPTQSVPLVDNLVTPTRWRGSFAASVRSPLPIGIT